MVNNTQEHKVKLQNTDTRSLMERRGRVLQQTEAAANSGFGGIIGGTAVGAGVFAGAGLALRWIGNKVKFLNFLGGKDYKGTAVSMAVAGALAGYSATVAARSMAQNVNQVNAIDDVLGERGVAVTKQRNGQDTYYHAVEVPKVTASVQQHDGTVEKAPEKDISK